MLKTGTLVRLILIAVSALLRFILLFYYALLTRVKSARVLGRIYIPELRESLDFEYPWGEWQHSIYKTYDDYRAFARAPWQRHQDTAKYTFVPE